MQFAHDYNNRRVHISDTHSNQEYYCPYCGAPLVTKKGDVRQHHFAHKQHHLCSDSWERNHSYDISPWHNEWQSLFPKENQEVKLSLGDTHHRADVMVDRTVIEFQHSIMAVRAFDDRNNFYFNFGNKVIWLFDLSDLFGIQLSCKKTENGLEFFWKNPKKAFNNYDIQSGCIDLFFQLKEEGEECIVRVTDVSENGFEAFFTTSFMSKTDFLLYVGVGEGKCLPPCREDLENNQQYCSFKEKYQIKLNKQQERALLAVEGSNLLLAVPGSGKTTVLVARLGHMVINKNISPESILAITYNVAAAEEMRERFSAKFGIDIGNRIDFRTINSLSYRIYEEFCRKTRRYLRKQIQDSARRRLLGESFNKHKGENATENDILGLSSAITYIKNMMLSSAQVRAMDRDYPHLSAMYQTYQETLKERNQMDFDDQMVFAHWILNNESEIANAFRGRYKYICVDEAQDTSKIQHAIVKTLAQGNSIFMVGDEDQSVYGFRAAYPRALLNFRYDYSNPYILRMERNYRSTCQIVEAAQAFISHNKGRYEKNMTAERGDGEAVALEQVDSREMQYMRLLEIARTANTETAFLYRDNESAVALIDLLDRNSIPFQHRKAEMKFFESKVVKEIVAYLTLMVDEFNWAAFDQICNKGLIYLKKQQREYAISNCKERHISIYSAIQEQMRYVEEKYRQRAKNFHMIMRALKGLPTNRAIEGVMIAGYRKYLEDEHLDSSKIQLMQMLANQEPDIEKFLLRLKTLEKIMEQDFAEDEVKIVLSTIHASKGLEYDSVYMVDVYDGRFPSSRPNIFCRSKDSADGEQEERRLFYVGITRAKNKLTLFNIAGQPSSFIEELFPEQREIRMQAESKKRQKEFEESMRKREERERAEKEAELQRREQERAREKAAAERLEAERKELEEKKRLQGYDEVKDKFVQQEFQIRDSFGKRWIQCELCGEIKRETEFGTYGGPNRINLGICYKCKGRGSW